VQEFLAPIVFVALLSVVFGLFLGNRYRSCHDCEGDCDKTTCEKK